MFLEILRGFQSCYLYPRNAGITFSRGLLFLVIFLFLPFFTSSARAEVSERVVKTPEALAMEFQELCRWKSDIAAFAALTQVKNTGSLEMPLLKSVLRRKNRNWLESPAKDFLIRS